MKLLCTLTVFCAICGAIAAQSPSDTKARDLRNAEAFKELAKYGGSCDWDKRMEHSQVICVGATAWDLDTGYPWKPEPQIKVSELLKLLDAFREHQSLDRLRREVMEHAR